MIETGKGCLYQELMVRCRQCPTIFPWLTMEVFCGQCLDIPMAFCVLLGGQPRGARQ